MPRSTADLTAPRWLAALRLATALDGFLSLFFLLEMGREQTRCPSVLGKAPCRSEARAKSVQSLESRRARLTPDRRRPCSGLRSPLPLLTKWKSGPRVSTLPLVWAAEVM